MNYKTIQQFSVPVQDQPGVLGQLTDCLGKAGLNVWGLTTYGHGDVAFVRFYCAEPVNKVETCLKAANYKWFTNNAYVVELPNQAGELGKFCNFLGQQGINIYNVYGISEGHTTTAKLVFTVDNAVKFEQTLKTALTSAN